MATNALNYYEFLELHQTETSVKLELSHFLVEGTVLVLLWLGEEGRITMSPFTLPLEFDSDTLLAGINDGNYGCQQILEADLSISAVYGSDDYITEVAELLITDSDLLVNAKRGI